MIEVFQTGILPTGQFDIKDADKKLIKGGEILVFDEASSTDYKAADIYSNGTRTQLRLANADDVGPFFVANADKSVNQTATYGLDGKSFYSQVADPGNLDVSSKQGVFTDEGFYAISQDVLESDIDSSTLPNTFLYVSVNGRLTTSVSASQKPVGVFVEYREDAVANSNPSRLYKTAGTFKGHDSIIFFKFNAADGYSAAVGAASSMIVVADEAARDTIDAAYREEGMLVSVLSTQSVFTLRGGVTNSNWEEVLYLGSTSPSATVLYVDIVAGNDANDGTVGSPLKTIQKAVDIFLPPHAPKQFWAANEDRQINVVYSAGMPAIKESIYIPYHSGPGALIIDGDEEVLHSLTQSGAGALVDGYYAMHQFNFSTSPLTLDGNVGDFVRITESTSYFKAMDRISESMPIYHNDSGYVWTIGDVAGFSAGLYYGNGVNLEITRPRIVWKPQDPEQYVWGIEPSIVCEGGNVIIQGFIQDGNYATVPLAKSFAVNATGGGTSDSGKNLSVLRCKFRNSLSPIQSSLMVASCIFEDDITNLANNIGGGLYIMNSFSESATQIINVNGLTLSGGFWGNRCYITGSNVDMVATLDIRGTGRLDVFASFVEGIRRVSVEGCTSHHAISVRQGSQVRLIRDVKGVTGNTLAGLSILSNSMVYDTTGTRTLAGALGEVIVGDTPFAPGTITTWDQGVGGGRVADANDSSIYQDLP